MDYKDFEKILLEERPSFSLRKRKEEIAQLIPEVSYMFDFDQHTIWHDLDVFEHTLKVVDGVDAKLPLRLAAFFHDIGKPEMMEIGEDGMGHFRGHWERSNQIFCQYQDFFSLTEEERYFIQKLILYHDLTGNTKNMNRFLEEFSEEDFPDLISLKKADALAHSSYAREEKLEGIRQFENDLQKRFPKLKNSSNDNRETILLLAAFCNNTENFSFKSHSVLEENFQVGIQTPKGFAFYSVPAEYWDLFDVVELDSFDFPFQDLEERNDRISSLSQKKKQYTKK